MTKVIYKKAALKALLKMPAKLAKRFQEAFALIAVDEADGFDIKKLEGREGYRLRIGGYRAIYRIEEGELVIIVLAIGSRGDIYK